MIRTAIVFFLSNYAFTFLLLGLIVAAIATTRSHGWSDRTVIVDKFLAWYVFFNVGLCFLYNFVMHCFFGAMSASFIGWADSPFQVEVGTASLGFAVVGFIAAFRSFDLRLAAVIGPALFTLGAAAGHVYQMVVAKNFAPGNAGVIFYTDIAIPLLGFLLLWLSRAAQRNSEGK